MHQLARNAEAAGSHAHLSSGIIAHNTIIMHSHKHLVSLWTASDATNAIASTRAHAVCVSTHSAILPQNKSEVISL